MIYENHKGALIAITTAICIYFTIMTIIGWWFRSKKSSEHLLAGRNLNGLLTAMSVASADTSSWVMIALPAAVYSYGFGRALIPIGLLIGSYLSWKFVASKLREQTIDSDSFTIPAYLARKCTEINERKKSHLIISLSSAILLIFFIVYIASGLKSGAVMIQTSVDIDYHYALIIVTLFAILYAGLGGMKAMSFGDLFQATLMLSALIALPISMFMSGGNKISAIDNLCRVFSDFSNEIFSDSWIVIFSSLAWGLGYFGEPHLLSKFMASRSKKDIGRARKLCLIWTFIAFSSAVLIGYFGKKLWQLENSETLFFHAVFAYYSTAWVGVFFAAVIAAIMSTICAQVIVAVAVIIENTGWLKAIRNRKIAGQSDNRPYIIASMICTLAISFLAFVIAFDQKSKIMDLVAYAWAGLGASFGPAVLYSLYTEKPRFNEVFVAMLLGFAGVIGSGMLKNIGIMPQELYEMIPGFFCGFMGIFLIRLKRSIFD